MKALQIFFLIISFDVIIKKDTLKSYASIYVLLNMAWYFRCIRVYSFEKILKKHF